ncbi:MAG: hypothetical protein ACREBU_16190, partial [Nitrososphaera sp.]
MIVTEFNLEPFTLTALVRLRTGRSPIKPGNRFAFEGDDPIDFEGEDSTLHFFFPKDYAHAAADSVTDFTNRINLRRYFYSDRGKDYMLVGVPWSWIDSATAGDLIIDLTTSATASEDVWLEDLTSGLGSNTQVIIGKARDPWTDYAKKRTIITFNTSGIPTNATVLNAQMKLYYYLAVRPTGSTDPWVDRWVQAHQLLVNWNE